MPHNSSICKDKYWIYKRIKQRQSINIFNVLGCDQFTRTSNVRKNTYWLSLSSAIYCFVAG